PPVLDPRAAERRRRLDDLRGPVADFEQRQRAADLTTRQERQDAVDTGKSIGPREQARRIASARERDPGDRGGGVGEARDARRRRNGLARKVGSLVARLGVGAFAGGPDLFGERPAALGNRG